MKLQNVKEQNSKLVNIKMGYGFNLKNGINGPRLVFKQKFEMLQIFKSE